MILDAPGVYDLDMYNAGIHFLTNGTYDLRSSDLEGTFTISNAVGTTVTVQPTPTANVINNGPTITLDYHERMMIKSADGIGLSSLIMINGAFYGGNPIAGWNYNNPLRYVDVNSNDNVSIFVHAYGYHPRIISGMGAIPEAANITLVPEAGVDTSLDTVLRDDLSTHFSAGIDGSGGVFLAVNMDMSTYAPEAVINALHFYLVKLGYMAAAGALISNSVDTYRFIEGGLVLNTNKFYGKIADSVTVLPDSGIYLPIYVEVDPAVMAAYPTFKPVKKNSSGLLLSYALWTKQSAQLTQADKFSTATIVRSAISPDFTALDSKINAVNASVTGVTDDVASLHVGVNSSITLLSQQAIALNGVSAQADTIKATVDTNHLATSATLSAMTSNVAEIKTNSEGTLLGINDTQSVAVGIAEAVAAIVPGATPTQVTSITEEKLGVLESRLLAVLSQ